MNDSLQSAAAKHIKENDTYRWICAACWHIVWGANPDPKARCGIRRMRHDPSPHYCHCDCENQRWFWHNE